MLQTQSLMFLRRFTLSSLLILSTMLVSQAPASICYEIYKGISSRTEAPVSQRLVDEALVSLIPYHELGSFFAAYEAYLNTPASYHRTHLTDYTHVHESNREVAQTRSEDLFTHLAIKNFVEEFLRSGEFPDFTGMSLSNRASGLPYSVDNPMMKLFQKILERDPEALHYLRLLGRWVAHNEPVDVMGRDIIPEGPKEVEGEYWDMATGVMPYTLASLGHLNPGRTYRFFDYSPYAVAKLREILKINGINNVIVSEVNLGVIQDILPFETKLAAIRVKNTVSYVPAFKQMLPIISKWIQPGGYLIFQFRSDAEITYGTNKHQDLLRELHNQGWEFVELTKDIDFFYTFILVKPENSH